MINIGYFFELGLERYADIAKDVGYKPPKNNNDDKSVFIETFPLTYLGEPVALVEYAASIARGDSTHAVVLVDFDAGILTDTESSMLHPEY